VDGGKSCIERLGGKKVEGILATIKQLFLDLLAFINEVLKWLLDLVLWVPREIYAELMESVLGLLQELDTGEGVQLMSSSYGELDGFIRYVIAGLNLEYGLSILFGAYVIRFLIRRIPVIG